MAPYGSELGFPRFRRKRAFLFTVGLATYVNPDLHNVGETAHCYMLSRPNNAINIKNQSPLKDPDPSQFTVTFLKHSTI
jgi:hypothetical protein